MATSLLRTVLWALAVAGTLVAAGCGTSSSSQHGDPTSGASVASRLAYLTVESTTGDLKGAVSHLFIVTPGHSPAKVRDYPGQLYYQMLASPDGASIAVTNGGAIVILDDRGDEVMQLDAPAVSWSGAGPLAAWSPDSRQFAYTHMDRTNSQIGWIETVDVAKRAVTTPPRLKAAKLAMPSYSPDGKRFVVVETQGDAVSALDLVESGSGDSRTLPGQLKATLATPLWSPDGRWIAYWLPNELTGPDGHVLDRESVYVTAADGGAPRRIAAATFLSPQAWSPDGKRLALSCAVQDNHGSVTAANVCVADAAGGSPSMLTDDGGAFGAAFAPDGTHIAFLTDRDKTTGTYALKVVNVNTREITTIEATVPVGGFSWLP